MCELYVERKERKENALHEVGVGIARGGGSRAGRWRWTMHGVFAVVVVGGDGQSKEPIPVVGKTEGTTFAVGVVYGVVAAAMSAVEMDVAVVVAVVVVAVIVIVIVIGEEGL